MQTRKYDDTIRVHEGDFSKEKWNGNLIEILFLDVCKSERLNAHALTEFTPYLIPWQSILLQQDFFHEWHPYIHWTLQYLREYLSIEASKIDATRVYRLRASIPESMLKRIAVDDFSKEEKVELLEELARESDEVANLESLFWDPQPPRL